MAPPLGAEQLEGDHALIESVATGGVRFPVVVNRRELQGNHQPRRPQQGFDRLPPLDQGDRLPVEQLVKPEGFGLVERPQPVHVEMVDHQRSLAPLGVLGSVVLLEDRKSRAGHRVGHRQLEGQALGEGGLAGTEITAEHDDVARLQPTGQRRRHRLGALGRQGAQPTRRLRRWP